MKFEAFERLLEDYKSLIDDLSYLDDLGFDFYEGRFPLAGKISSIVRNVITESYGQEGWDWVEWFLFEDGKAWDAAGKPICYDVESLYAYLENHVKH